MNCTSSTVDPATLAPTLGAAIVELVRVRRGPAGLLVLELTDGSRVYAVDVRAADLSTFERLRSLVADRLGLWIDHWSQDQRHSKLRRDDWKEAVARAFDAGMAE